MIADPLAPNPALSSSDGSSSIVGAVQWLQGALLGTVATTLAVIAVAWLGFLMLRGHLPIRRAGAVLLGCFILFGASAIAQGLMDLADRASAGEPHPVPEVPPIVGVPAPAINDVDSTLNDNADPYAGAAVPRQ